MVVTCAHKSFPEFIDVVCDDIKQLTVQGEIYGGQVIPLHFLGYSGPDHYDLAVFRTEYSSDNHLTIRSPEPQQKRLTITSFSIGLTHAVARDKVMRQHFIVIEGFLLNISDHHIVYQSNLFSGDSGGAVICASDGRVIGLHSETVNEAGERIDRGRVTAAAVNQSLNSFISGLSQGFVGVRLDTDAIEKTLANNNP